MSWAEAAPNTPSPAPQPRPTTYAPQPQQLPPGQQPSTMNAAAMVMASGWFGAMVAGVIDWFRSLPQVASFSIAVIAGLTWAGYVIIPAHIEKIDEGYRAVVTKAEEGQKAAREDFKKEIQAERDMFAKHLESIEAKSEARQQKMVDAWDKQFQNVVSLIQQKQAERLPAGSE